MTRKYKRNFLSSVIFRIDFNNINLGGIQSFFDKIKGDFPCMEEEKGEEGYIGIDFKTKEVKKETTPTSVWVFTNKTKTKKIKIHSKFLFIEYNKYKDSKELLKDIESVKIFIEYFSVNTINRMGLRYVNKIKFSDTDYLSWDKYLDNNIIGPLNFILNKSMISARAMCQMVLKEDFGNINFNYGIWNDSFPNEINEKSFILDFDGYSKFPLSTEGLNLSDLVKTYNNSISNLFESVIKKPLRDVLSK